MTAVLAVALLASLTARELLDCSIAYHDPNGRWDRGSFEFTDVSRPVKGTGRRTVLRFDNARGRFEMESSIDGRPLEVVVENEKPQVRLDGKSDVSPDELERNRLTPAQLLTRRNFYLYLWGLPMKLRDPGTRLDPTAKESIFGGRAVFELRVTYDPAVGSDTWNFYLDRGTCALVGHRFQHGDSSADGEYAVLSEEVSGAELRLPRVRKWYTNKDDQLFVTHELLSIGAR